VSRPLIRRLTAGDAPFVEEMLLAAFTWDETKPARTMGEMRHLPEIWHYVEGWPREDDFGVVATDVAGVRLGAAWARYFGAEERGYGFVRESVPEIGMGIIPDHRGGGLGGSLLDALIEAARERGAEGLSLSVEDGNGRARRLYERRGFEVVGREGDSDVMVLTLGA
jgi:ribosomal protein S18 acetylase RimI-like enzyme